MTPYNEFAQGSGDDLFTVSSDLTDRHIPIFHIKIYYIIIKFILYYIIYIREN